MPRESQSLSPLRRRIRLGLVTVLLVCAVFYLVQLRKPRYEGKNVTGWIGYVESYGLDDRGRAAFSSMGARAVPFLLDEVDAGLKTSPMERIRQWLGQPNNDSERLAAALRVIRFLGPEAEAAAPRLIEAFQLSGNQEIFTAIPTLGTEGRDFTLQTLKQPSVVFRVRALSEILLQDWRIPEWREDILRLCDSPFYDEVAYAATLLPRTGGMDEQVDDVLVRNIEQLRKSYLFVASLLEFERLPEPIAAALRRSFDDVSHSFVLQTTTMTLEAHAHRRRIAEWEDSGAELDQETEEAILNLFHSARTDFEYIRSPLVLDTLHGLQIRDISSPPILAELELLARDTEIADIRTQAEAVLAELRAR